MTEVLQPSETSYSMVFGPDNPNWTNDRDCNVLFLRGIQTYLSHLLCVRGHVLLNDVFDSLGTPRRKEGFTIGWLRAEGSNPITFTVGELGGGAYHVAFN